MAVLGTIIAVTTAIGTLINPTAPAGNVVEAIIRNTDAAGSIWLGGSTVGTAGGTAGYQLNAGSSLSPVRLLSGETLYGIAQSGTINVHVLATHV